MFFKKFDSPRFLAEIGVEWQETNRHKFSFYNVIVLESRTLIASKSFNIYVHTLSTPTSNASDPKLRDLIFKL